MRKAPSKTAILSELFGNGEPSAFTKRVKARRRSSGYIAVVFWDSRGRDLVTHMPRAVALDLATQLVAAAEPDAPRIMTGLLES